MVTNTRQKIIIGQEASCPDGLGRVIGYEEGPAGSIRIQVQTYFNDRSCKWDYRNVELIPPFNPNPEKVKKNQK